MPTSFQEFLEQKVEGTDWKDRRRRREEWTTAVARLLNQIQVDLRESDPAHLLEIVPYEVQRAEGPMGVYDAPALSIRLGTESVEVVPMDRYARLPMALQNGVAIPSNQTRWGDLSGGRVDITDGDRRHLLFRSVEGGQDRWYALKDRTSVPVLFDRRCLEEVLEDLLR